MIQRAWLKAPIQSEKPHTLGKSILHEALSAMDRKWAMNNVCLCVCRLQRFSVKLGASSAL